MSHCSVFSRYSLFPFAPCFSTAQIGLALDLFQSQTVCGPSTSLPSSTQADEMTTDTFHDTVVVMTGTLLSSLMVDNMQPGSEKVAVVESDFTHLKEAVHLRRVCIFN